jgi:hypothetical protein
MKTNNIIKNNVYNMYKLTGGHHLSSIIIDANSFEEAKIKANQLYFCGGLIGRYYLESKNGYIEQLDTNN